MFWEREGFLRGSNSFSQVPGLGKYRTGPGKSGPTKPTSCPHSPGGGRRGPGAKQGQQWWVLTVAEPPAPGICSPGEPQAAARTRWRSGAGGMVSTYRVAVLGARGVGKSAIVRQFLYNEFSEVCVPTTARRLYLPAVVMNGHVHDLQILDFPPISTFPVNTLQVGGPAGVASRGVEGWGRRWTPAFSRLWPCPHPSGSEGSMQHHRPPCLEPSRVCGFIQCIFNECITCGGHQGRMAGKTDVQFALQELTHRRVRRQTGNYYIVQ